MGRLYGTRFTAPASDILHLSHMTGTGADCSGIIATGTDASPCIAIGSPSGVTLSVNHGRLDDDYNLIRFDDTLSVMSRSLGPDVIAGDLHPGLASSRIGRALAHRSGASYIGVDHAHAHIAAVMAEHSLHGDVAGIVLDSHTVTDTADSRRMRGAEILLCSRRDCRRMTQGDCFVIPRGHQPWEAAVGLILHYAKSLSWIPDELVKAVGLPSITEAARRCCDRADSVIVPGGAALWDAAAAIIATATGAVDGPWRQGSRLEELAAGIMASPYTVDTSHPLSAECLLDEMLDDLGSDTDPRVVAARFVATQARAWSLAAARVAARAGIARVVAGGDLLRHPLLRAQLARQMKRLGLTLYMPERICAGDAGVAVGQATVAAARRA